MRDVVYSDDSTVPLCLSLCKQGGIACVLGVGLTGWMYGWRSPVLLWTICMATDFSNMLNSQSVTYSIEVCLLSIEFRGTDMEQSKPFCFRQR